MPKPLARIALVLVSASLFTAVSDGASFAVAVGEVDDFSLSLEGWAQGHDPAGGIGLTRETSGGPAGAGDAYARIAADGTSGARGKIVMFNSSAAWTGNWTSAGAVRVSAKVRNLGNTALQLYLKFESGTQQSSPYATTTTPVNLAAGGGWVDAEWSVAASTLTTPGGQGMSAATVLTQVARVRIHHDTNASDPTPTINGILGVDDIRILGGNCGDALCAGGETAASCPGDCPRSCGDGARTHDEPCEGGDLGGETCVGLGFDGGVLACSAGCAYATGACFACGDGEKNGAEGCDGDDVGGATCASEGFDDGVLGCAPDCSLTTDGCWACGDGKRDEGESCDGEDLGAASCEALGFDEGVLACGAGCELETGGCIGMGCGDGLRLGDEACDGLDVGDASCESLDFDGGVLACTEDCAIDTTSCFACGDGAVDPGEACDGTALGGASCVTLGFAGGELACREDCSDFAVEGCSTCGDGIVDEGEGCDDGNGDAGDGCAGCTVEDGWICDAEGCVMVGDGDDGEASEMDEVEAEIVEPEAEVVEAEVVEVVETVEAEVVEAVETEVVEAVETVEAEVVEAVETEVVGNEVVEGDAGDASSVAEPEAERERGSSDDGCRAAPVSPAAWLVVVLLGWWRRRYFGSGRKRCSGPPGA